MLWTAFLVLLIFWLMAFSIQVGWLLIHSLLSIGFGPRRAAPAVDSHTTVFPHLPAPVRL